MMQKVSSNCLAKRHIRNTLKNHLKFINIVFIHFVQKFSGNCKQATEFVMSHTTVHASAHINPFQKADCEKDKHGSLISKFDVVVVAGHALECVYIRSLVCHNLRVKELLHPFSPTPRAASPVRMPLTSLNIRMDGIQLTRFIS